MASPRRKVLLVESWLAGSHRAWAEGFQNHSRHDVELLTAQPGGWRSTIERSARVLAARAGSTPDLLLASSMMDLVEFRARSGLEGVPTLLYLHENQLTYDRVKPDLASGAINWRSVECADRIAFNSDFHFDDFFAALPSLGLNASALGEARGRSIVLPVGIDRARLDGPDLRDGGPPVVLWNHRWESDKNPDAFIDALAAVGDLSFRLILAGGGSGADRYRSRLVADFGDRVLHTGLAPVDLYSALLRRADVVVSSARQEFFGLSIAEAMSCGVVPLVPNRLAYPELLGSELAPGCLYEPGELASGLRSMLLDPARLTAQRPAAEAAGRRFDWKLIAPRYDDVIDSMV